MTFDLQERADALSGADLNVSLLASAQYFRQVAWTEPLPDEEHHKLLQRVIRGNSERVQASPNQWVLSLATHARERLVEVYQPLVIALARRRKFLFQSMDLLDVIQEGNIGLLAALDDYDAEVSCLFSFRAVAAARVKYAISAAASDRDAFVRLPADKDAFIMRKRLIESQLRKHLGRQPLLSEIAEMMDVSEVVLHDAVEMAKRRDVASIQGMLATHEIPEDRIPFVSLYASAVIAEDKRQEELAATFQHVFDTAMPEKQREILELRYGFGEAPGSSRSYELIGEMSGIDSGHAFTYAKKAKKRLVGLLEPVVLADGRLSCVFRDLYTDDYCNSREAASLLGMSQHDVNIIARQGLIPFEMRSRRRGHGSKERVFKKVDVLSFQEQQASAPVKLATRRKNDTLAAARRSAALPSVVA